MSSLLATNPLLALLLLVVAWSLVKNQLRILLLAAQNLLFSLILLFGLVYALLH